MPDFYTAREVAWLLSLTRDDAIKVDASPADSFASLSSDSQGVIAPSAEDELLVIARWHDVQTARRSAQAEVDHRVVGLRTAGFSEAEIGRMIGRSQQTVSRRFRATIDEILAQLHERPTPKAAA